MKSLQMDFSSKVMNSNLYKTWKKCGPFSGVALPFLQAAGLTVLVHPAFPTCSSSASAGLKDGSGFLLIKALLSTPQTMSEHHCSFQKEPIRPVQCQSLTADPGFEQGAARGCEGWLNCPQVPSAGLALKVPVCVPAVPLCLGHTFENLKLMYCVCLNAPFEMCDCKQPHYLDKNEPWGENYSGTCI